MNSQRAQLLALNHAATIFVSAFLLFQVQPLISKCILPWFGGSAAVWTTCMLFFQSLLFLGYAYAHFSVRWLRPAYQAILHLGLIVAAIVLLRVIPNNSWEPLDSTNPVGDILVLLAATVGLPYFVLSSTGPLVQAWFARSLPGKIPYRLYALSNFGSLLALLSYPFVFERVFDLPQQATFWSWGFAIYAVLCAASAVWLWMMFRSAPRSQVDVSPTSSGTKERAKGLSNPEPGEKQADDQAPSPQWWQVLLWLGFPSFASVVLLATTNHVCTDIAVIPFLWVIPLSLYLVTFIVAFDHPRWYRPVWIAAFTMVVIYLVAALFDSSQTYITLFEAGTPGKISKLVATTFHREPEAAKTETTEKKPAAKPTTLESPIIYVGFPLYVGLNFAAMFGICMLCHGELVRIRPDPKYLTLFYLMISAGGALGAAAVTFYAPKLPIFATYYEFNLSLLIGFAFALCLTLRAIIGRAWRAKGGMNRSLVWAIALRGVPLLLVAGVAFYDLAGYLRLPDVAAVRARNFFGTLSVQLRAPNDPWMADFALSHGRIVHGAQFINPERNRVPTTYYAPESGVGRTMGYFRQNKDIAGMRVGAVGLGTGTLAAYIGPQDYIRFYEINPYVIAIAEAGKWFTFLKDCEGKHDVELGDARLTLEHELRDGDRQKFHVLVLDAFSGDAIPMHLLTEEAFKTYLEHMATPETGGQHGAIAVHITNRYVDLEPVVRALAERFGLDSARVVNYNDPQNDISESDWIVLSRNQDLLKVLREQTPKIPESGQPPVLWTDARSNLFDVLKWHRTD